MWKQKIGISISNNYSIPTKDVIKLVRSIGFDAISPEWEVNSDIGDLVRTARECELLVQSLHAPFDKAAGMWSFDETIYMPAKEELLKALEDCRHANIPQWLSTHGSDLTILLIPKR